MAMSGGVDSSVAAALLLEQGHKVIGVTMNLWEYDRVGGNINRDSGCCSVDTMDDARCVCSTLGVPFYVVNFREEFEAAVKKDFTDEYLAGRTPNPCVRCNTYIKWGALLDKAEELGATKIATGHYARSHFDAENGRYILRRGRDPKKDQSYALYGIKPRGLQRTLFPIGDFNKNEIREMARKFGLRTAEKAESQEICFIPENDYTRYLQAQNPELASLAGGDIVNKKGEVLGHHKGFPFYTIGQRKGLGLSLPEPVYVTKIDAESNQVTVGANHDLENAGLLAGDVNWVSIAEPEDQISIEAKIRYNSPATPAMLQVLGSNQVRVIFAEPQRAVTSGQSVVFYDGDVVLGGGIIQAAE